MKLKMGLWIVAVTAAILSSCTGGEEIINKGEELKPSEKEEIGIIPPGKMAVSATEDLSEIKEKGTKAYNDRWECTWKRGKAAGYGYYDEKDQASMTVTPASGWTCSDWNRNGNPVGSAGNYNQPVNNNYVIVPYFKKTVTVTYNGNGGTASPTSGTYTFIYIGDAAQGTISFPPATATRPGYSFTGWFTAASGGTQVTAITESLETATTLYAHWGNAQYNISISGVNCTVSGGGSVNANSSVTVKATPTNSSYEFDGWYEGTTKVSNSPSYTFTAVANRTLVAKYAKVITITIVEVPVVSGGYTYYYKAVSSEPVSREIKVSVLEGYYDMMGEIQWTGSAFFIKSGKTDSDLYGTDVQEGVRLFNETATYDGIIYKFLQFPVNIN